MRFRWICRLALGAAALAVISCSGLSPEKTNNPPIDPNSPCGSGPTVFSAFPGGQLAPINSDTTLEIVEWNLRNFGDYGEKKTDPVASLMGTLHSDIFAVEEIADTTEFRALLGKLPGYAGVLSPETSGSFYQKTGVVYNTANVTLNSVRVPPDFRRASYPWGTGQNGLPAQKSGSYVFVRPPIEADLTVYGNGKSYEFRLIVVHLKAGTSDAESADRRRASVYFMHAYMDTMAISHPGIKFVVAGDWNDLLTKPIVDNSFPSFLEDSTDYKFLTMPMAGRSDLASHPLGLIDQILVNKNACPDFSPGRITTLRLDLLDSSYSSVISDHRPVMAVAPVFK